MAEHIKIMGKWDFGLSKAEALLAIGQYVWESDNNTATNLSQQKYVID